MAERRIIPLCGDTTTTSGTGTVDIANALPSGEGALLTVAQALTAGDIATGETVDYTLIDGSAWEIGIGTITDAATDTLARTTLLRSSTGSKISLSGGTTKIILTPSHEQLSDALTPSGSTFPSNPVEGMHWYRTDRKILYSYVESAWKPISSFGAITLYVDSVNSSGGVGWSTGADAAPDLSTAWDEIPSLYKGNITIELASGHNDTGGCNLLGKTAGGPYTITINGSVTLGSNRSLTTTPAYESSSDSVKLRSSTLASEGDYIEFTSGAADGMTTQVRGNDGTDFFTNCYIGFSDTIGSFTKTLPANNDTYAVVTLNSTLTVASSADAWKIYDQNITIQNLKVQVNTNTVAPIEGEVAGFNLNRVKVVTSNASFYGCRSSPGQYHAWTNYQVDASGQSNGVGGLPWLGNAFSSVTFDGLFVRGSSAGRSMSEGMRSVDPCYINVRGGTLLRMTAGFKLQYGAQHKIGNPSNFGKVRFEKVTTGFQLESGSWCTIGGTPVGSLSADTSYTNTYFKYTSPMTDVDRTTAWGVPVS